MIQNCHFCAKNHPRRACPTYGKRCDFCGKNNHFKIRCTQFTAQNSKGRENSPYEIKNVEKSKTSSYII